jgi:signal peptidase I
MPFASRVSSARRFGSCSGSSHFLTVVHGLLVRRSFRRPPVDKCSCVHVRTVTAKTRDRASLSMRSLSGKDKRRLTKELKQNAKKSVEPAPVVQTSSWRDRLGRFVPQPRPRIPGGSSNLKRDHFVAAGKRLPFWLLLAILVSYDDTSPFVVDHTRGPSMLPTIFPIGDLYLRDTGAWHRALGIRRSYQVGDVVVFISPVHGGGYSCKRIVAVEGNHVLRYGQFAHMYKHRDDLGIVSPRRPGSGSYNLSREEEMMEGKHVKDISYTVVVPPGHVWLEGDFPLFSVDSRHYGALPSASINGRLLMRVWPLWREDRVQSSPIFLSRERPLPLTREEALTGGYNLYIRKSAPSTKTVST